MTSYHSIWQQFDLKEQAILTLLAPFQQVLYYHYDDLWIYLSGLTNWHSLRESDESFFYDLIRKATALGIYEKMDTGVAFLRLHPLFQTFLKKSDLYKSSKLAHNGSFVAYYFEMTKTLYWQLKSGEEEHHQEAIEIINYEYANLIQATHLSIGNHQDAFLIFISTLERWFIHHNELKNCLLFYQKIQDKVERKSDPIIAITFLNSVAGLQIRRNAFTVANQIFRRALSKLERLENLEENMFKVTKVGLQTNIGITAEQTKEQIEYLQKALKLAKSIPNYTQFGNIAYNLSEAYFEQRQFTKSEQHLRTALTAYKKNGASLPLIKAYQSLATHQLTKKQYRRTKKTLEKALKVANQLNNIHQKGILFQELASLSFEREQWQKAKNYAQAALEIFITTQDEHQQANAYNLLSVIAFERNEMEDGLTYAQQALTLYYLTERDIQVAQTHKNIAFVAYKMELYRESKLELLKAIEIYRRFNDEYLLNDARIHLANTLLGLKDMKQAKAEIEIALTYFDKRENVRQIQNCVNSLSFILKDIKDVDMEQKLKNALEKWKLVPKHN